MGRLDCLVIGVACPQLGHGLPQDRYGRAEEQCRHDARDEEAGLGRAGAKPAECSQHDGHVAARVVARTGSDRTEVGVTNAKVQKEQDTRQIRRERKEAHRAHHRRLWQARPKSGPECGAEYPEPITGRLAPFASIAVARTRSEAQAPQG